MAKKGRIEICSYDWHDNHIPLSFFLSHKRNSNTIIIVMELYQVHHGITIEHVKKEKKSYGKKYIP